MIATDPAAAWRAQAPARIADTLLGGVAYQHWGYIALTDDDKAKLASSGTLTDPVEWLPSPKPQ